MNVWGITDRGVIRTQNQDAFAHQVLPDGRVVALVCDGMGGAKAGNVASAMAVDIFMREFLQDEGRLGQSNRSRMERSAASANEQIFHRAITEPDCGGMGTTIVAALVEEGEALILNEGDSRAYHLSEEKGIVRVTRDHSLVEDLVQRGELTPDQARVHPHKNLITRALGAEPELRADLFRQKLSEGDFLLLCSDGLSNMMDDQEILFEVVHGVNKQLCCQRLLDIAKSRGAPDNVTSILVQV